MTQNWPTPVDAGDYFRHEQKKVAIEERRPIIRRASDLVGPGIAASAVRVTDWSDTLATFDGFYASVPGAYSAPNSTEAFVGFTVMDSEIGGAQVLTGMTTGIEHRRVFRRNPSDADSILWGDWASDRDRIAATVESAGAVPTTVPSGIATDLFMPSLVKIGDSDPWLASGAVLNITQPGVYTGHISVSDGQTLSNLTLTHPTLSGPTSIVRINVAAYGARRLPLTFATTTSNQYLSLSVVHETGVDEIISITSLALTRTSQI